MFKLRKWKLSRPNRSRQNWSKLKYAWSKWEILIWSKLRLYILVDGLSKIQINQDESNQTHGNQY